MRSLIMCNYSFLIFNFSQAIHLIFTKTLTKEISLELHNLIFISDTQLLILLSFIKHILNQHIYLSQWSLTTNLRTLEQKENHTKVWKGWVSPLSSRLPHFWCHFFSSGRTSLSSQHYLIPDSFLLLQIPAEESYCA